MNEPVAYAVFANNGNIRIWCADPAQVETLRQQYGEALQPLYAHPQPAEQQPDVTQLVEALEEARDLVDSWASYASDYFKEKHNLARDLERLDAVIAAHRKAYKLKQQEQKQ